MKWFNNLKITAKLALTFGVLLVIMAGLGTVSIMRLNGVAARAREIAHNWLPSIEHLDGINTAKSDIRVEQLRLALAATSEDVAQFDKAIEARFALIEEKKRLYVPLISDEAERGLWNEFDRQ